MNPEAAAAPKAFEQMSPRFALDDPDTFNRMVRFFRRGSKYECWALLPPEFRCDCVSRQASLVSPQGDKPPQSVKSHAKRGSRTSATPQDAVNTADRTETVTTQGHTGQEKGQNKGQKKGQNKGQNKGQKKGQEKGQQKGQEKGQEKGQQKGQQNGEEKGQGKDGLKITQGQLVESETASEVALNGKKAEEDKRAEKERRNYLNSKSHYGGDLVGKFQYVINGLDMSPPESLHEILADKYVYEQFEFSKPLGEIHIDRAYTLYKRLKSSKSEKLITRYKQRIGTLLYGHEIDEIARYGNFQLSRGQTKESVALDVVAEARNTKRKDLRRLYKKAKIYLQYVKSGGSGTLLSMEHLISYLMQIPFDDIHGLLDSYRKKGLPKIEEESRRLDKIAHQIIRRSCISVGLTEDVIAKGETPLTAWIHAQDLLAASVEGADPDPAQDSDDGSIRWSRGLSMASSECEGGVIGTGSEMRTGVHDSLSEGHDLREAASGSIESHPPKRRKLRDSPNTLPRSEFEQQLTIASRPTSSEPTMIGEEPQGEDFTSTARSLEADTGEGWAREGIFIFQVKRLLLTV
ncbi:hypothetical protein PMIN04_012834 [Paraphaeosphaeria minitans]